MPRTLELTVLNPQEYLDMQEDERKATTVAELQTMADLQNEVWDYPLCKLFVLLAKGIKLVAVVDVEQQRLFEVK